MAEGGSSPISDPGGLHLYTINGGPHKMTELVAETPGRVHMLNCHPSPEHGLYSRQNAELNHFSMSDSRTLLGGGTDFIQIEPLQDGYQKMDAFEDLKPHPPQQPQQHYYGHMDEVVHQMNAGYDMNMGGFTAQPSDMYKLTADNQSGYINMLGCADMSGANMFVKKEKLDYDDQQQQQQQQHLQPHADMIYPPNTSVADWQYFNAVNASTTSNGLGLQPDYHMFNSQTNLYPSGHFFNNHPLQTPMLPSNIDIHNQSKKITENIMSSTEWGTDTLYKSKVYSTLATDPPFARKRRHTEADISPRKSAKSRRKKSADLGGHSKTAASILLSNTSPVLRDVEKNGMEHRDDNVLDSNARNSLVSSLMNNLRSTVQFESFCLSFPQSKQKEAAFQNKVLSTVCLINSIESSTNILSNPIPPKFAQGASKLISAFQRAVKNTSKDTNGTVDKIDENARSFSADQVEEHLPHSMVWVVKLNNSLLSSSWEGQFVTTVNPIHSLLSFSVFQFQPHFSAEGIKGLHHGKLTKELACDIIENMEQFEVSRQLRLDLSLDRISQICLYTPFGDAAEGCLLISASEEPAFFQRWLHTSAEEKNKWHPRANFLSPEPCSGTVALRIGGLVSELNELVALMIACNSELACLLNQGAKVPFQQVSPDNTMHPRISLDLLNNGKNCADKFTCQRPNSDSFLAISQCNVLSDGVLDVLMLHEIITEEEREDIERRCENDMKNLNSAESGFEILQGKKLSSCFKDYVNYRCKSANELSLLLCQKVSPNLHGFFESDFDMDLVPGGDINELSVGELISNRCSNIVYFSFCSKKVGQLGHDHHCTKCRQCTTWQFWHCDSCNKCSNSGLICEYSGHLRDDQSRVVIKPLSVLKAQKSSGTVRLDDGKPQWEESLKFDSHGVISWPLPYGEFENEEKIEYNATTAMIDQLGLLNPVGFLLGQSSTGACRKHRRQIHPVMKSTTQSKESTLGSSCTVQ